jgi:hypothetical protein
MPYYQPEAALQLFNRTINSWDIATGSVEVDIKAADYATEGEERSTYWSGPSEYKPPVDMPVPPGI